MELRHLRYFIAVAEALSFTRAAQALHTAQPSLSQQIRDLEHEIGVVLLERNKRHVALTPAGRVFLDEARLVIAQAERAKTLARRAAADLASLTIGFVPAAEVKLFSPTLNLLRASHPAARVVLQSLTTYEQHQALLAGDIDMGFLRPPISDSRLASEVVLREPLVALLPADHALAAQPAVSMRDLAQMPFLRIASRHAGDLGTTIDALASDAGVDLTIAQEVENVLTLLSLIGIGMGCSIMPDYVGQLGFRNLAVRPLRDAHVEVALLAAWRRDNAKPEIGALLELVRAAGQQWARRGAV